MLRILSFTIYEHPVLGNQTFDLGDRDEMNTVNYFSLIIGANGTGKSYLLRCLIEAFNEIAIIQVSEESYKPKKRFSLTYFLMDKEYYIEIKRKQTRCEINNKPADIRSILLPSKWLAISTTINDRYPILNYSRNNDIHQYNYLGIRSATNNAFLGRIKMKTVLHLVSALRKNKEIEIRSVFNALDLMPIIQFEFVNGHMLKKLKEKDKIQLLENPKLIVEKHVSFIKKNEGKTSYRADNYKKYLDKHDLFQSIAQFLARNKDFFRSKTRSAFGFGYSIDLREVQSIERLTYDWDILNAMIELELIKIDKFIIMKNSPFLFESASSGEHQLLTSFLGIIANIENNSLLLIDEPEISLHPNWQIGYIELLKTVLKHYKGINVIVASHSHFMVTNLKNEESRIITIRRNPEDQNLTVDYFDFETYGWDPERILYRLFNIATIRNKYFEDDLRRLIFLMSEKSKRFDEIESLREKLAKYIQGNDDDPLALLLKQAATYLYESKKTLL